MGQAMEILTGFETAGSTLTALTMATGNTLTIRSAPVNSDVFLMAMWAQTQAVGAFRVRSPRLHDNQQGIRVVVPSGSPISRYPRYGFKQKLIPQDTLTAELVGSSSSGKIETGCLLVYYTDLPGIAARFITPEQLAAWGLNMMGQEVDIALGATGGYSGQVAVNSLSGADNWKANTDYALMGYEVDTDCACVRIQGADSGNLGLGGPGSSASPETTGQWFVWLSDYYHVPAIPVFNAANKLSILVDGAQNDGGADTKITFFFVELKPPSMRA